MLATPSSAIVWDAPALDHSVGAAGIALRDSTIAALERPSHDFRDMEILEGLSTALGQAADQGILITPDVFNRALTFLQALPTDVPLPRVVVESDTEIGADWDEANRRVLSLTVDDSDFVGFSALFGHEPHHGRFRFVERFPETLAFLLSQLYPAR